MKVVWHSSSPREDLLIRWKIDFHIFEKKKQRKKLKGIYRAGLHIEHIPQKIIQRLWYVKKYDNQHFELFLRSRSRSRRWDSEYFIKESETNLRIHRSKLKDKS